MSGAKGRSGGYRPGAGRKPGSIAIKKKPKSKGIKKPSSDGQLPVADPTTKKLTAFFSTKPAVDAGMVEVRAASLHP